MAKHVLRVGVVGPSSLAGKELVEELGESQLGVVEVVLVDEDVESGKVTAVGDEASFVQQIGADSFDGMDLCFFAGSTETTRRHWRGWGRGSVAVGFRRAKAVGAGCACGGARTSSRCDAWGRGGSMLTAWIERDSCHGARARLGARRCWLE